MSNRILVLGANGQLGHALRSSEAPGMVTTYADIEECDLTDAAAVSSFIADIDPQYIINCSAYTAVDRAEDDVELVYKINRDAVQTIADNCRGDRRLIHISTDFVFDGRKRTPYQPGDAPAPLGVYGQSKLAGEVAALNTIPEQTIIIRTAWLYYTMGGNGNFVETMLRLMSERDEISVVNDQRGTPTFAASLASAIWRIIERDVFVAGIYHWTDDGSITWYEFACAIQEESTGIGLLSAAIPIHPIGSDEYPTPAARPAYSVLDTSKLEELISMKTTPWRDNLRIMLSTRPD